MEKKLKIKNLNSSQPNLFGFRPSTSRIRRLMSHLKCLIFQTIWQPVISLENRGFTRKLNVDSFKSIDSMRSHIRKHEHTMILHIRTIQTELWKESNGNVYYNEASWECEKCTLRIDIEPNISAGIQLWNYNILWKLKKKHSHTQTKKCLCLCCQTVAIWKNTSKWAHILTRTLQN